MTTELFSWVIVHDNVPSIVHATSLNEAIKQYVTDNDFVGSVDLYIAALSSVNKFTVNIERKIEIQVKR